MWGEAAGRQAGRAQTELSDDLQAVQSYCQPSVNNRVAA